MKLFNFFLIVIIAFLAYLNFSDDNILFVSNEEGHNSQKIIKDYFNRQPKALPNHLLASEKNTISVFEHASPSVVFITNNSHVLNVFTTNIRETPQGSGTGFFWDNQGHIVTNFHVINGADSLVVSLGDYSQYKASVVGIAPHKDIAVIKIDAPSEKMKALTLGASNDLRVGQKVMAIGNPFGLDHSLTTGVVSALNREITAITGRKIQNVIQADAAINPGNSGGPLLDSRGHLIGVNTAIVSPSGSSAGIGFAVPIDTVKKVVPQLIKHGKLIRPGLGVKLFEDAIARRAGINGVLIQRVQRGSSAEKAGLRGTQRTRQGLILGDIIVGINNVNISVYDDLGRILEDFRIGDEVSVTYIRNDKKQKIAVKLQQVN